ncbi:phosphatase PAP2 family protein [Phytohabitans kaempferiae]|uniref:Phosphatase PAP2 family protein n=1 Tax=Phytohabitans kaempferiae TaxID=1620943 RepID=A0ABV6MF16_9ACTN
MGPHALDAAPPPPTVRLRLRRQQRLPQRPHLAGRVGRAGGGAAALATPGALGRAALVAGAAAFALFVAASRVLLLAHWPTDVLGGWLLALTVVPLTARAVTARTYRHS